MLKEPMRDEVFNGRIWVEKEIDELKKITKRH